MCIMCIICLGCRKKKKPYTVGPPRPSTTDESEAIIDNMVVPPKRRRSTWLNSSSTVFGSVSDSFSPPTTCLAATASSPNYIHPRLSAESALYVESYPLCRPEPPTQFPMDSCGGSTAEDHSKPCSDACGWDGYTCGSPLYDVPLSYKKSVSGDEPDEVFTDTSGSDSEVSEDRLPVVSFVNVKEGMAGKYEEGKRYKGYPDITDHKQKGIILMANKASTFNGRCSRVNEKGRLKPQDTPPLPRATLSRMTVWNPLDVPNDAMTTSPGITTTSANPMTNITDSVYDRDTALKPRPCSVPHYVNFKGCRN